MTATDTNPPIADLGCGITRIDAGYVRPGIAAFYMMVEGGQAAFIDTGTSHSLATARQALRDQGLEAKDVRYVIPTHVHLDHAGGAGALMQAFRNAELVVHPRGARHMIDPSRLVAGTISVYGEDRTAQLYGTIVPVDEDRVIIADDEFELDFNGRVLQFFDTPGHARHHFCVSDIANRFLFTGDTMGISYRVFDSERGPFVFPTTTPVQFDPPALHASMGRLMATDPRYFFLTHFGPIEASAAVVESVHQQIDDLVEIAVALPADATQEKLERDIGEYLFGRAKSHAPALDDRTIRKCLEMDVKLNTQGIWVWLQKSG